MIIVARHSIRADQVPQHGLNYQNNIDPPITSQGVHLALSQGYKMKALLKGMKVITIHASPFLRCVQTAACLARAIYQGSQERIQQKIFVHNDLGEVMNYQTFPSLARCKSNSDLVSAIPYLQINTLNEQKFIQKYIGETKNLKIKLKYKADQKVPFFNQGLLQARRRFIECYLSTLQQSIGIKEGQAVIVVTHRMGLSSFIEIFNEKLSFQRAGYCSFSHAMLPPLLQTPSSNQTTSPKTSLVTKIKNPDEVDVNNRNQSLQIFLKNKKIKALRDIKRKNKIVTTQNKNSTSMENYSEDASQHQEEQVQLKLKTNPSECKSSLDKTMQRKITHLRNLRNQSFSTTSIGQKVRDSFSKTGNSNKKQIHHVSSVKDLLASKKEKISLKEILQQPSTKTSGKREFRIVPFLKSSPKTKSSNDILSILPPIENKLDSATRTCIKERAFLKQKSKSSKSIMQCNETQVKEGDEKMEQRRVRISLCQKYIPRWSIGGVDLVDLGN